jgi:hypothetical protein
MKTEQIKKYRAFIYEAINVYWTLLRKEKNLEFNIEEARIQFSKDGFEKEYNLFEIELLENMRRYPDDDTIAEYINSQFSELVTSYKDGFDKTREIINGDFEIELLLSLQDEIKFYRYRLAQMGVGSFFDFGEPLLAEIRKEKLNVIIHVEKVEVMESLNDDSRPAIDTRFDISVLVNELEAIIDLIDKIKLIKRRMHELSAWEIQFDEMNHSHDFESYYIYSTKYYPNFRELCELEINHIEEELKLEERQKKQPQQRELVQTITLPRQKLVWNKTPREFVETFHKLIIKKQIALNGNHDHEPIVRVLLDTFDIPKLKGVGFVNEESMLTYFRKENSGDVY